MEETNLKVPPDWWLKVIKELEEASLAAKSSFVQKNTVLELDTDNHSNTLGYLIRMPDGQVGYYPAESIPHRLPMGVSVKGKLPTPEKIVDEPSIESFTFDVIRENIRLVPRMWLRKVIGKILTGKPVTPKEDLKAFPQWVLLPLELKQNKVLIDLLYRAASYEGLKGLARYNDLVD